MNKRIYKIIYLALILISFECSKILEKVLKHRKYVCITTKYCYSRWGPYKHPIFELQPQQVPVNIYAYNHEFYGDEISNVKQSTLCWKLDTLRISLLVHDHNDLMTSDHWTFKTALANLVNYDNIFYEHYKRCVRKCYKKNEKCRKKCKNFEKFYKIYGTTFLIIDYSQIRYLSYPQAVGTIRYVSTVVFNFLKENRKCRWVHPDNKDKYVWFPYYRVYNGVGAGMGAHLIGQVAFALKKVGGSFYKITGLNPSTFLFQHGYVTEYMDETDAKFTVSLKSAQSFLEHWKIFDTPQISYAKTQLIVNRGYNQPNCEFSFKTMLAFDRFKCDYDLAIYMYLYSINIGQWEFYEAKNYKDFIQGRVYSCYEKNCYYIDSHLQHYYSIYPVTLYTITLKNEPYRGKIFFVEIICENAFSFNGKIDIRILHKNHYNSDLVRLNVGYKFGTIRVMKLIAVEDNGDPASIKIISTRMVGKLKKISIINHQLRKDQMRDKYKYEACFDQIWLGNEETAYFGNCRNT